MKLILNSLQVYFLAALLEPHRDSDRRFVRNLVKKNGYRGAGATSF